MAIYGVETWGSSGKSNNTGIRPFNPQLQINLAENQSGSWSIENPYGLTVGYVFIPVDTQAYTDVDVRRRITVSGNTVTVSNTGSNQFGNVSNRKGVLFITLVGGF